MPASVAGPPLRRASSASTSRSAARTPARQHQPLQPRPGRRAVPAYEPRLSRAALSCGLHHGQCIARLAAGYLFGSRGGIIGDASRIVPATGRATARRAATAANRSNVAASVPGGIDRKPGRSCSSAPTQADEHLGDNGSGVAVRAQDRRLNGSVQARLLQFRHGVGDAGQRQLEV